MKKRMIVIGAVLIGTLWGMASTPVLADSDPLVGRWDMTILYPDHPRISWLGVEKKDGKYVGLLLREGGSPGKAGEVKLEGSTVKWEWRRGKQFFSFT
ncbi:MAG: hypothetical protein JSV03_13665, partial [Planctomycetota bacterium]